MELWRWLLRRNDSERVRRMLAWQVAPATVARARGTADSQPRLNTGATVSRTVRANTGRMDAVPGAALLILLASRLLAGGAAWAWRLAWSMGEAA